MHSQLLYLNLAYDLVFICTLVVVNNIDSNTYSYTYYRSEELLCVLSDIINTGCMHEKV